MTSCPLGLPMGLTYIWKLSLLVLTILWYSQAAGASRTTLTDCTDIEAKQLEFLEHGQMSLCCKLGQILCQKTTLNDSLTLCPKDASLYECENWLTRERCLVKYEKPEVTQADAGWYRCSGSGVTWRSEKVSIVDWPPKPDIHDVYTSEFKRVTVVFDSKISGLNNWQDRYQVILQEIDQNTTICNETRTDICDEKTRLCTCSHKVSYLVDDNQVTLEISVSRMTATEKTIKTLSLTDHVRPTLMDTDFTELTKNMTSNHAHIQLCPSQELYTVNFWVSVPIRYNFLVSRAQGSLQTIEFDISPQEREWTCLLVHLENLTAFTNYTVAISGEGKGGEGPARNLSFKTHKAAPSHPPHIDSYSFIRSRGRSSAVVLVWQALPEEMSGGSNITYSVKITAGDGQSWSIETSESWAVLGSNPIVPKLPWLATVWAHNEVGKSPHFSEITIPNYRDTPTIETHVEFLDYETFVYINSSAVQNSLRLAVHWCKGRQHTQMRQLDICEDFPKTLQGLSGLLTPNTTLRFVSNEVVNERYNQIEMTYFTKDSDTSGPYIVNATSTSTEITEEYDPENDTRSIRCVKGGAQMSCLVIRKLQPWQDKCAHPRFLLSQQSEMFSSGMMPAKCYYSRRSDEVRLTVSFVQNESGTTSLRWRQDCDSDRAQQFLADYFTVYTATDELCEQGKSKPFKVSNPIMEPCMMDVPQNVQFACVIAHRLKSDGVSPFTSKVFAAAKRISTESGSDTLKLSLAVSFGIIALAIATFVVILCTRYCYGRYKRSVGFVHTDTEIFQPPRHQDPPECPPFPASFPPQQNVTTELTQLDSSEEDQGLGSSDGGGDGSPEAQSPRGCSPEKGNCTSDLRPNIAVLYGPFLDNRSAQTTAVAVGIEQPRPGIETLASAGVSKDGQQSASRGRSSSSSNKANNYVQMADGELFTTNGKSKMAYDELSEKSSRNSRNGELLTRNYVVNVNEQLPGGYSTSDCDIGNRESSGVESNDTESNEMVDSGVIPLEEEEEEEEETDVDGSHHRYLSDDDYGEYKPLAQHGLAFRGPDFTSSTSEDIEESGDSEDDDDDVEDDAPVAGKTGKMRLAGYQVIPNKSSSYFCSGRSESGTLSDGGERLLLTPTSTPTSKDAGVNNSFMPGCQEDLSTTDLPRSNEISPDYIPFDTYQLRS